MPTDAALIEKQLAELPNDSEYTRQRVDLLIDLLLTHRGLDNWRRLSEIAEEAFRLAKEADYDFGRYRAQIGLGFGAYWRSDYRQAIALGMEAEQYLQAMGDERWIPEAVVVQVLSTWSLGQYDKAMELGMRALRLYQKANNQEGLGWSNGAAGNLCLELGDPQQALSYLLTAREIFQNLGHKVGLGRVYTSLGSVYRTLGEPELALSVTQDSLPLFREMNNRIGEARALNDLGLIYFEKGDYASAELNHLRALELREAIETPAAQITSLLHLGKVYLATQRFTEAKDALLRALRMSEQYEAKPKLYQAHHELSELYEKLGDFKTALQHHHAFHKVRDEVFNEETNTKLRNLQVTHEVETSRKEAEIYRLKNVELATALADLQAAQAQLVQSEKMAALGDLVAGVAHEMNSPLGVMLSSTQSNNTLMERLLRLGCAMEDNVRKAISVFEDNNRAIASAAARIDKIVRSLKGFARLDEAEFQRTDLHRGIEETLTLLEPLYRGRVEIVREYGKLPEVDCYAADLNQVFRVLLKNAIEAIEVSGSIRIRTCVHNTSIELRFSDTGRGMSPEALSKLFQPSFRSTGTRVEARLGLFTAFNIIRKHGGDIRVSSEEGKGTEFRLVLPLSPI